MEDKERVEEIKKDLMKNIQGHQRRFSIDIPYQSLRLIEHLLQVVRRDVEKAIADITEVYEDGK